MTIDVEVLKRLSKDFFLKKRIESDRILPYA
jgi:hypothetical protein